MKHLKRTDIEAIGKDIYTQYRKLPEIRSARIICNIQPDLLIEKLLGFKIEYHHLSLSGEVLGITCTDEIGIEIYNDDDSEEMILLDGKTILIEKDLKTDTAMYGRYQFTKCHEAGHLIYKMLFPNEYGCKSGGTPVPQYSKIRKERSRNGIVNWEEWQADVLASVILMPTELIEQGMFWLGLGERIKLLNKVYSPSIYEKFCTLAEMLGASKQALAYRLQKLGMIEHNQLENPYEYLNI